MVSTTTAPVFSSVRAASNAARSQGSTCAVSTPIGPNMFISMEVVAPYIMLAATTRLGRSISAASTAMWMPAIPEAQAIAPAPLSSSRTNSSSAERVGLS